MRLRWRSREHHGIDVSAFADVAFLLIIFFILTTTFVKPAGHKLDIPSGSPDPAKDEKQLTVTLTANTIHYGSEGRSLTMDELRETLQRENFPARKPDQRVVILESTPDVPYERYFQAVMAIASADGVLALIEEEGGGESP